MSAEASDRTRRGAEVSVAPLKVARDPATSADQLRALRTVYAPELDRLLARHPNAPADLLEVLSHSADKATRRHVVRHSCTPKEVLLRLAPQFPRDFLYNPVIDFLLIEEPDLLQTLGRSMLRNILKSASCPESLMGWAVRNGNLEQQFAVAMNPAATPELLLALVARGGQVAEAARAHTGYAGTGRPGKVTSKLFITEVCQTIAAIDAENASYLWRMGLLGPAQWLRLNAESRAKVLGLPYPLVQGSEPGGSLCRALAKAPATPEPMLGVLSRHRDREVRERVAANVCTPAILLEALSKDSDLGVRSAVVRNPSTPAQVLEALSKDSDESVRSAAAGNPRTPEQVLEALSKDSDRSVRSAVAGNPSTPERVLEALAKDSEQFVSSTAIKRIRRSRDGKAVSASGDLEPETPAIRALYSAAADPNAPPEVLTRLARRRNLVLRWLVANNPGTSDAVRRDLAHTLLLNFGFSGLPPTMRPAALRVRRQVSLEMDARHWWHKLKLLAVRHGYSRLPKRITGDELVERFQQELRCLAREPSASLAAQIIVAGKRGLLYLDNRPDSWQRNRIDLALKLSLSGSDGQQPRSAAGVPRLFALAHANAPVDALVKAYRSVDWLERLAVARNLNTPQRLVDGLKKDANRLVAQQAAETEALQHELQQWPALAIRIHDRWKSTLVGIVAGMTEWDGLDGETADCLKRVRHHREALSPLLSNTHAQAALIGRVVGEIILRSRDQELVPAFWNDPVWIQQFDVADFWSLMLPVDIADVAVLRRLEAMLEASEWQHLWTHLAGLQRVEIKVRVARHPLCPDYILRTLSKEQSAEVRAAVAQNPKADEVGTEQEPTHRPNGAGERSRRQVASDPLTLPKVLEQLLLSSDESPLDRGERMAVARNPSTPPHVLEKLSKDLDVFVRAEVASNPNSSISVIESLAKNPDRWIERALLKNPKTPPNLLASLATDFWSDTRCAVAAHPSTPATVLDDLSKDSNSKVRAEAARAANLSVGAIAVLALDRDKTVRLHVACRSDLAPDTLAELARDNSVAVREAVASHPLAPPATVQSLLRSLAIDSQPHVRANAARHPSVSESLLAVLANDDDRGVRLAVAQRRYLSELRRTDEGSPVFTFAAAIKMALLRERGEGSSNARSPHPWSAEDILYGCYALQLVPRQPTARFMNKAVRSKDWLTRLAMALHPHATRTHLKLLGEDDVADVVAAVNSRATQREHR